MAGQFIPRQMVVIWAIYRDTRSLVLQPAARVNLVPPFVVWPMETFRDLELEPGDTVIFSSKVNTGQMKKDVASLVEQLRNRGDNRHRIS